MIYHSKKHGPVKVRDMNQYHLGFAARKLRQQNAIDALTDDEKLVLTEMEQVAKEYNWTIPD